MLSFLLKGRAERVILAVLLRLVPALFPKEELMSAQPHASLAIDPSWFTDPAPPFWVLISELDQRVQIQAVNILIDTQIAMAKVQLEGLQNFKKVAGGIKAPAGR